MRKTGINFIDRINVNCCIGKRDEKKRIEINKRTSVSSNDILNNILDDF